MIGLSGSKLSKTEEHIIQNAFETSQIFFPQYKEEI